MTGSAPFAQELADHLRGRYAFDATLTRLGSERDATYRASVGFGDVIVKVCAADEPRDVVELQLAVADHLARTTAVPVPVAVPTTDGASITRWERAGGEPHRLVYVISCLPGTSLADRRPSHGEAERVGAVHGGVTAALAGFRHPAAARGLLWDLSGLAVLAATVPSPPSRAGLTAHVVKEFTRLVRPVAERGTRQVVHGDYSLHNVLVDPAAPGFVTGLIDFGDTHVAPVIYDLAIAVSNLIDHRLADPWSLASAHVRGFLSAHDVPRSELRALATAAAARCVQRALVSQWRAATDPSRADYVRAHARHDWVSAEAAIQTRDIATDQFLAAA